MLNSQKVRKIAPEMDPLRMGMGWTEEDLEKPQIIIESTYGQSHPGSAHLLELDISLISRRNADAEALSSSW